MDTPIRILFKSSAIARTPAFTLAVIGLLCTAFTALAGPRPTLVMIMAEDEYEHAEKLPPFAQQFLSRDFNVIALHGSKDDPAVIVGLEEALPADVLLVSVRRRPLEQSQMQLLRRHVQDGKPVVGLRTASHAFASRRSDPGPNEWRRFDPDVLGGNYSGHHGNRNFGDPEQTTYIRVVHESRHHPILQGIPAEREIATRSWLYRVRPLGEQTEVLMMGRVGHRLPHQPVAWTNHHIGGGRVFYTSKGHPDDFDQEWFQRLLRNGIYWAAGLSVPEGP